MVQNLTKLKHGYSLARSTTKIYSAHRFTNWLAARNSVSDGACRNITRILGLKLEILPHRVM